VGSAAGSRPSPMIVGRTSTTPPWRLDEDGVRRCRTGTWLESTRFRREQTCSGRGNGERSPPKRESRIAKVPTVPRAGMVEDASPSRGQVSWSTPSSLATCHSRVRDAPAVKGSRRPAGLQSDTVDASMRSALVLCDNGRPLGPAHSLHTDIERSGQGRFSHGCEGGSSPDRAIPARTVRAGTMPLQVR
jgi:hypothetical protein